MARRSIYKLMDDSVDTNNSGIHLPDDMTFNLNLFEFSNPSDVYLLAEEDVFRFDQVMINFYGSVDYYQEVVLYLNKIDFLTVDYIGKKIYLPLKEDMDSFYLNKLRGNL
ncbi:MAG: hypothetical protein PF569_01700 [Candidatus Woesearchaeota archaeon]|jgi:hypothetical protein|nr:hypothetical protein [Candidatus Woesearchaeota archaeon]